MVFAGDFTPVLAKTLEVVLADRLHFGRRRPDEAKLRADAKAGRGVAEK